jgi:ankyrin repeat protein
MLDEGFDPNYIEYYQKSLINLSVEKMKNEIVYDAKLHFDFYCLLKEYGAKEHDEDIFTIIHSSNVLVLEKFLENRDLNVDVLTNSQTALMLVSGADLKLMNVEMVKILLNNNADKTIKDQSNKSALDYAMLSGNQEIIDLLSD